MNLAELVLRLLAPTDWAAFREIRLAALRDAPEAFGSTAAEAQMLEEHEWRRRLEQRTVFMAEAANQRVGLVAGIGGDQPGEAELVSMWVAPAWRGRGVGDRLVEAVLGWAAREGFTRVRLWVAKGNTPAERLYARHGFDATGRSQPMGGEKFALLEFEMSREVG